MEPQSIPELIEVFKKYSCPLASKPLFVLVGEYNSETQGPIMGVLAGANNEMHAHILKREINKSGNCDLHYTEFNKNKTTFRLAVYESKIQEYFDSRDVQCQ